MEISQSKDDIISKAKELHAEYAKFLPAFFFSSGFGFDLLTLGDIDDYINILSQAFYLIIAGHILFLEFCPPKEEGIKSKYLKKYLLYREDIFHFLLGALLSAFTIFYFKSASIANSFLFLLLLVALLFLNEVTAFKRLGHIVRSSLFMLCLLSYFIYVIPVLFGKSGIIYFVISSLIAVSFVALKSFILQKHHIKKKDIFKSLIIPQISVVLVFMILYFFKVIPPVPLSLKHIGIYHAVKKKDGKYITFDEKKWYNFWSNGDQNFSARADDKVFVFTKVFAPAGFEGLVYITWLKNTPRGLMVSDRIPLSITGGRRGGFRGFSYKSNYTPGDWQVRIETNSGLEIGRVNLTIKNDDEMEQREFNKTVQK